MKIWGAFLDIKNNPYRLADDISGIDFQMADYLPVISKI